MTATASIAQNLRDQAIVQAIKLCASGPETLAFARATLEGAGWTEDTGENDGKSLVLALASSVFAHRFDPEDVGFSATDAGFMASQILGNSALGPDPLSFSHGDVLLGVLGIRENTPYCVVAGPGTILDVATEQFAPEHIDQSRRPPRPVVMREAPIGDGHYIDLRIDLAKVAEFDPQVGRERSSDYRMSQEEFDDFLAVVAREANMHISSAAAMQER